MWMVGQETGGGIVGDEWIVGQPLDGPALGADITERVPRWQQVRMFVVKFVLEPAEGASALDGPGQPAPGAFKGRGRSGPAPGQDRAFNSGSIWGSARERVPLVVGLQQEDRAGQLGDVAGMPACQSPFFKVTPPAMDVMIMVLGS
jgi:hypothetical protein